MSKQVKFSLFFPADNKFIGLAILDRGFDYFLEAVEKAEKLGFEAVFLPDHYMLPQTNAMYEAWINLAALASKTNTIRMATGVTPIPFYHPAVLAKRVVTLDCVSKGRFTFGVGCGWYEKEFKTFGVPFDPLPIRCEKMLEGLEIIKALLNTETPITFHGKYYTIDQAELLPKPIQKPHPPMWFGGSSIHILRATAKHGQGWIPWEPTPNVYKAKLSILRKLALKSRREPLNIVPAIAIRTIIVSSSEEAREHVKSSLLTPDDLKKVMIGTPEDCIDKIHQYVKSGVQHFSVGIQPPEKAAQGVQIFSEEVIPYI